MKTKVKMLVFSQNEVQRFETFPVYQPLFPPGVCRDLLSMFLYIGMYTKYSVGDDPSVRNLVISRKRQV